MTAFTPVTAEILQLEPLPAPNLDLATASHAEVVTGPLRKWNQLDQGTQAYLIQDWVTRSWPSLMYFCSANLLEWDGTWRAFAQLKLVDRAAWQRAGEAGTLQLAKEVVSDAVMSAANSVRLAVTKIATKMQAEDMDPALLLTISNRVSTDGLKLAMMLQAVVAARAAESSVSFMPANNGNSNSELPQLPPAVRKQVAREIEREVFAFGDVIVKAATQGEK